MAIDLAEVQTITKELADMTLKLASIQSELSKPIARIKELAKTKNQFGDEVTALDRQAMFDKAKVEFNEAKTKHQKVFDLIPLPTRTIERPGQ